MTDTVVAAEVIALLGRLRQACALLQAAIPTGELTHAIENEFAATCVVTVDALRRFGAGPPPAVDESLKAAAHETIRRRPSCTTVATSSPDCVKNRPVASPRPPEALGETQS